MRQKLWPSGEHSHRPLEPQREGAKEINTPTSLYSCLPTFRLWKLWDKWGWLGQPVIVIFPEHKTRWREGCRLGLQERKEASITLHVPAVPLRKHLVYIHGSPLWTSVFRGCVECFSDRFTTSCRYLLIWAFWYPFPLVLIVTPPELFWGVFASQSYFMWYIKHKTSPSDGVESMFKRQQQANPKDNISAAAKSDRSKQMNWHMKFWPVLNFTSQKISHLLFLNCNSNFLIVL